MTEVSEAKNWTFVDKEAWGDGPWQDEPDKVEWRDPNTGLPCIARRGPSGAWCGYVAVGPGHPWHGKAYDHCLEGHEEYQGCWEHSLGGRIEVHGGLTYCAFCWEDEETGICHVPREGESPDAWWFGFDCAHAWDLCPAHRAYGLGDHDVYRDLAYVREQVTSLAAQLTPLANPPELL